MKDMTGAVMAPFNAMLILRGLKTLALRMERHCAVAQQIRGRHGWRAPGRGKGALSGLESFEQHELARRQMARLRRDDRLRTEGRHRGRPYRMMNRLIG
jgi:methionine-gamma-lyase